MAESALLSQDKVIVPFRRSASVAQCDLASRVPLHLTLIRTLRDCMERFSRFYRTPIHDFVVC